MAECALAVPPFLHGFSTEVASTAFEYACQTLNVRPEGPQRLGFSRRSLSGAVRDRLGETWLKVTAASKATNFFREGEATAPFVDGVRRPQLLQLHDWQADGLYFRALQTSLAKSPAVEPTPLAGRTAAAVTDAWIAAFKENVCRIGAVETRRYRAPPDAAVEHIRSWFGPEAPCVADDYCAAHGDANWSNVTGPNLTLLDWEVWGLAPRGFDLAYLIVFSCVDAALTHRLEAAFADELASRAGQVAQLICLGEFLNLSREGSFPATCQTPAMQMAHRILARRKE